MPTCGQCKSYNTFTYRCTKDGDNFGKTFAADTQSCYQFKEAKMTKECCGGGGDCGDDCCGSGKCAEKKEASKSDCDSCGGCKPQDKDDDSFRSYLWAFSEEED